MTDEPTDLLTTKEAAAFLNVSTEYMRGYGRPTNTLPTPYKKVGVQGLWWSLADLDAYRTRVAARGNAKPLKEISRARFIAGVKNTYGPVSYDEERDQ